MRIVQVNLSQERITLLHKHAARYSMPDNDIWIDLYGCILSMIKNGKPAIPAENELPGLLAASPSAADTAFIMILMRNRRDDLLRITQSPVVAAAIRSFPNAYMAWMQILDALFTMLAAMRGTICAGCEHLKSCGLGQKAAQNPNMSLVSAALLNSEKPHPRCPFKDRIEPSATELASVNDFYDNLDATVQEAIKNCAVPSRRKGMLESKADHAQSIAVDRAKLDEILDDEIIYTPNGGYGEGADYQGVLERTPFAVVKRLMNSTTPGDFLMRTMAVNILQMVDEAGAESEHYRSSVEDERANFKALGISDEPLLSTSELVNDDNLNLAKLVKGDAEIVAASERKRSLNIVYILLDTSGSMNSRLPFISRVYLAVTAIGVGRNLCAMTVEQCRKKQDAFFYRPFETYPGPLCRAVSGNEYEDAIKQLTTTGAGGGTFIGAALDKALEDVEVLSKDPELRIEKVSIVILSDFRDGTSYDRVNELVTLAASRNVKLYGLGLWAGEHIPYCHWVSKIKDFWCVDLREWQKSRNFFMKVNNTANTQTV